MLFGAQTVAFHKTENIYILILIGEFLVRFGETLIGKDILSAIFKRSLKILERIFFVHK